MHEPIETPYILVATVARDDATTTLFFAHLKDRVPMRIAEGVPRSFRRLLQSFQSEIAMASHLAGATALIVNRGLFEFSSLTGCARAAAIPCYYFIDDNFIVLSGEGSADLGDRGRYTIANVRRALQAFDGVLCATESLQKYFIGHELHRHVTLYPPVAAPAARLRPRPGDRLRIGFFGGAHRREPFTRLVLPAIDRLAQQRPVTLVAAGVDVPQRGASSLDVIALPYQRGYSAAISEMASHDIDILVHPTSITDNNAYKNPHVLINAGALAAAPVFSDAPPYDALAGRGVCLLTRDSAQDWFDALSRLGDAALRATIVANIAAYNEAHFNGDLNVRCLQAMMAAHPAGGRPRSLPLLKWRLARGFLTDLSRRLLRAA